MKQSSQEVSKFKEAKRGFLRNGEEVQYIVIQKAHDGRIAQVFVGEWITTNAVEELVHQAQLFQQEQQTLLENEKRIQEKHFGGIIEELKAKHIALEKRVHLAELEVKYIQGLITEEEYLAQKGGNQ